MLWKKNKTERNQQLDQLGRTLIQASQASEEEIERSISSPAIFERIRARAADSESRPSIDYLAANNWATNNWAASLSVAWRAIPALSLVAIIALALWLGAKESAPLNTSDNRPAGADIIMSAPVSPVTACSVATKEECAVSTDDAVAILVTASGKEANR
jgi:hypothetical protein